MLMVVLFATPKLQTRVQKDPKLSVIKRENLDIYRLIRDLYRYPIKDVMHLIFIRHFPNVDLTPSSNLLSSFLNGIIE